MNPSRQKRTALLLSLSFIVLACNATFTVMSPTATVPAPTATVISTAAPLLSSQVKLVSVPFIEIITYVEGKSEQLLQNIRSRT